MISIYFEHQDLHHVRFSYSPLIELMLSYKSICHYAKVEPLYHRWKEYAAPFTEANTFHYLDAVSAPRHYVADFVTPTPTHTIASIEDEFQRILATPAEIIVKNMELVIAYGAESPVMEHFMKDPHGAVECLVAEMRHYWEGMLLPHWSNMRTILENDILYRARHLAVGGLDEVLSNLTSNIAFDETQLFINNHKKANDVHRQHIGTEFDLGGRGIYLVPSIFLGNHVMWQVVPEFAPMLIYGARGAGLWQTKKQEIDPGLELTLGAGRARVLQSLVEPTNTSDLANRLDVTAGSVSQHLSRLDQAGLVDSYRNGNRVVYRLSMRGERLLQVFEE